MSGEITVRTTSNARALMKALNVRVSVLPSFPRNSPKFIH